MEAVPVITQLSTSMEEIRKREVEKALSRLPHLKNGQRQILDAMTNAMIKKILHHPITKIKGSDDPKDLKELLRATRELFGLKE